MTPGNIYTSWFALLIELVICKCTIVFDSIVLHEIGRLYEHHVGYQTRDALGDFMNGAQADSWGIPDGVVWDSQGGNVFNALAGDFMKPVVDSGRHLSLFPPWTCTDIFVLITMVITT